MFAWGDALLRIWKTFNQYNILKEFHYSFLPYLWHRHAGLWYSKEGRIMQLCVLILEQGSTKPIFNICLQHVRWARVPRWTIADWKTADCFQVWMNIEQEDGTVSSLSLHPFVHHMSRCFSTIHVSFYVSIHPCFCQVCPTVFLSNNSSILSFICK